MPSQPQRRPRIAPAPSDGVAAEWVPLSTLRVWAKNPRRNAEAVPKVRDSLIRFGWGRPLVARTANRELIIGHTARLAALELASLWADPATPEKDRWHPEAIRTAETGFAPVRFKDLPEKEAHLLALADNRLGEYSQWEDDVLADVLKEAFDSGEQQLDVTGFLQAELDLLLGRGGADAPTTGDGESVDVSFTVDTGKELIKLRVAIADGERTREAVKRALEKAKIEYEFG